MEKKIINFLRENYFDVNLLYSALYHIKPNDLLQFGEWVLVQHKSGAFDRINIVYRFIEHDVYIMLEGFKDSYGNMVFSGFDSSVYVVRPIEVIRKEYQIINDL